MATAAATAFFHEHAGFSYDPKSETQEQGRNRCAQELAQAEEDGRDAGLSFDWSVDQEATEEADGYIHWLCVCRDVGGHVIGSLGAVDFGTDGDPWDQPERRVVEASLALDALR